MERSFGGGGDVRRVVGLIDLLILLVFAFMVLVILTGGFVHHSDPLTFSATSTRNPGRALLLLLLLRKCVAPSRPWSEVRLFRMLLGLVDRLRAARPAMLRAVPLAGAAAYALIMSVVTIRKHEAFQSHGHDLGIFDQVMWRTVHGDVLGTSMLVSPHFFGEHVSPILLLVAPLYALVPDPRTLLWLQTVALASGAFAVYWIATRALRDEAAAALFSLAYLAYQPMRNANLFDFHPIALATPLLLFAFHHLESRQWVRFGLFLALAMACQEEIAILVAALGIYVGWVHGRRKTAVALFTLGAVILALDLWVVVPHFRNGPFSFTYRYSYLGSSIPEIVTSLVTHPLLVLRHTLIPAKLDYLVDVFGPVAFLPFAAPAQLLLTAPTFFQNVLSDYAQQYSTRFQYTSPLTPFVFGAAIYGLRRLGTRPERIGILLALLVVSAAVFFGESPARQLRQFAPTAHHARLRAVLRDIPAAASVSAQDVVVPHLSRRAQIHEYPALDDAEYVVLDASSSTYPLVPKAYDRSVRELLVGGDYGVTVWSDSILVLKRGHPRSLNAAALQSWTEPMLSPIPAALP